MQGRHPRPVRAEIRIAITGAASASGRSVRDVLVRQKVPAEQVRLLDQPSEEAIISEYGGQAMLIGALDPGGLSDRDLVFLCGRPDETAVCLGWARNSGSVYVDLSGTVAGRPEFPVVNVSVNPEALRDNPRTVAAPHPISFGMTSALAPLVGAVGVEQAADPVTVRRLLKETRGLSVGASLESGASPVETEGHEEIHIAEVSQDGLGCGGFWLWALGSDWPGGAAKNAVEIAERLLSG